MKRLNLLRLINTPNISPIFIDLELRQVFETVITQRTNPSYFFNFEFVCFDATNRARLVLRYGWSPTSGWMFDILAPSKNNMALQKQEQMS